MKVFAAIAVMLGTQAGCFSTPCDGPTCTAVADAAPNSLWDVEHTFSLGTDRLAEAQLDMVAGARVVIDMQVTPHAIEWDMHSHDADGLPITYMGGRQATAQYEFVAPHDDVFFAMWSNTLAPTEATLTIKLMLHDGAQLVRWR